MTNIIVQKLSADVLVVDSRLVADSLDINHKNFLETIRSHRSVIESNFGHLAFQTETVTNSVKAVNQIKFALLTEDQSIFIASLSRNTVKVVQFKASLVKAFSLARKGLKDDFLSLPSIDSFKQKIMIDVSNIKDGTDVKQLSLKLQEYKNLTLKHGELLDAVNAVVAKIEALY